ncbi:Imm49 family immunity protein [Streptomyces sp. NPDC056160]|uniref:Imm49 family immunity protein n=1 Tax=Streptomyces sp. NPDC056160 TaxID=3345731 RepID=UPI0035D7D1CD
MVSTVPSLKPFSGTRNTGARRVGLPRPRASSPSPPLAIACIAHDAGMPIEVESEYLPIALLGRNWCGEFPT